MNFYPDERVALFIDGSNLYATAKTLGFDIDYKRLLGYFRKRSRLIRAIYYTALLDDAEYSPIKPLIDWLDYNGYRVVTKPAKEYTDAMGRRKVKGNMDIELAIDVMQLAEQLDHIVLFSGDGDFRSLVAAVQAKGRRVTVISTLTTRPPMIADDLRRQTDQFIDLADLARRDWPRSGRARGAPARPQLRAAAAEGQLRRLRRHLSMTSDPGRDCPLCPRLVGYRHEQRAAHPEWFNAPVPSFGDGRCGTADRRAGARRSRRQPHRPALHRRFRRRSALWHADQVRLCQQASSEPIPRTG